MADSPTRKRALEILADPRSKENEWLGALAILDGKVPADRRKLRRKFNRFLKRAGGLSIIYMLLFSVYGTLVYGQGFYWTLIPAGLIWGTLEASVGLFTMLAAYVFLSNLPSILTLDPAYQTTWMVVLANLYVYRKWKWQPYVLVPVKKVLSLGAQGAAFKALRSD